MLEITGKLREFPLPALYGDGGDGPIGKLAPLCGMIAQTEGLRFWPPHSLSFLLICSLRLYNYCSGVEIAGKLHEFPLPAYTSMVVADQFASSHRFVR